jgi:hypothetical protein
MRFTEQDADFLRNMARQRFDWSPYGFDVGSGATRWSYTNMGHEGNRRVDRLVAMGLMAIEHDILVVVEPASPSRGGLVRVK